MSQHPIAAAVCLSRAAVLVGLSLTFPFALTACGGGGIEAPAADAGPATAARSTAAVAVSSWAEVEGCVVDRFHVPATGTPVRALGADGRLLGQAQSDARGRFVLRLPARGAVVLEIDRAHGETLPMQPDAATAVRATCLVDERA